MSNPFLLFHFLESSIRSLKNTKKKNTKKIITMPDFINSRINSIAFRPFASRRLHLPESCRGFRSENIYAILERETGSIALSSSLRRAGERAHGPRFCVTAIEAGTPGRAPYVVLTLGAGSPAERSAVRRVMDRIAEPSAGRLLLSDAVAIGSKRIVFRQPDLFRGHNHPSA